MIARFILCIATFAVFGFTGLKTSQSKLISQAEPGKFRVAILYPNGDGKTFDMDYYEKKHMPMVASFLGDNLKSYEIDLGISGRTANDKPAFVAIGYFNIEDVTRYNEAISKNRDAIINDFKNYTNIQPVVQINEVKLRHR